MTGRIKATVAFRALNNARKARAAETHTHAVYCVKKNGTLYAKAQSTHASEEAAQKQADYLKGLNPGTEFRVIPF